MTIARAPLTSTDAQALIGRLNAELTGLYPDPADRHFELTAEQVAEQGVFLIARIDGEAVGCAALRQLDPSTGEIKRMYVAPAARGARLGSRLLSELERHARRLGHRRLLLETGEHQHEALRLYERAGFARIPAFGEYQGSAASICMEKKLS